MSHHHGMVSDDDVCTAIRHVNLYHQIYAQTPQTCYAGWDSPRDLRFEFQPDTFDQLYTAGNTS
jgi:hypothetical protein